MGHQTLSAEMQTCAAIDNRLTSICKIVLKPPQFMVLDAIPILISLGEVGNLHC